METYKDVSGTSGIVAYEIGDDFIRVQFKTGAIYKYTKVSAGEAMLDRMKVLAQEGKGLGGYITKTVKNLYALKELPLGVELLLGQIADLLIGATIVNVTASVDQPALTDIALTLDTGERLTISISSDRKLSFAKEEMLAGFRDRAWIRKP